jgi:hypothetical protein
MRGARSPAFFKGGSRCRHTPCDGPREPFIPPGTSYLGQTDVGEPMRWCNVLFPDRRPP